jgi:hypothetical protein
MGVDLRGRDRIALGVRGNQSRRDPAKPSTKCWVSVFEVLSVPDGTIDEMLAIAELHPKPKAERFYRPL